MDSLANVFGRGTPAGEALYRCYTKPTKPSTLNRELAAAWAEERSQQRALQTDANNLHKNKRPPLPIALPRVGQPKKMTASQIAEYKLRHLPHRRSEKVIQAELDHFAPPSPPSYRKPALTSHEKDRLTEIMEYGYVLPEPGTFTGVQRAKLRQINKEVALRDRFAQLEQEANEIKRALAQLSSSNVRNASCINHSQEKKQCKLVKKQNESNFLESIDRNANTNKRSDDSSDINSNIISHHIDHQSNKLVKQENGLTIVEQCVQEKESNNALRTIVAEMELVDVELRKLTASGTSEKN